MTYPRPLGRYNSWDASPSRSRDVRARGHREDLQARVSKLEDDIETLARTMMRLADLLGLKGAAGKGASDVDEVDDSDGDYGNDEDEMASQTMDGRSIIDTTPRPYALGTGPIEMQTFGVPLGVGHRADALSQLEALHEVHYGQSQTGERNAVEARRVSQIGDETLSHEDRVEQLNRLNSDFYKERSR